ncbi:MAG: hypothetical protein Q4G03_08640 [Planctomycetia bacterium]|nr:hypothetical protein [Planctomycetia bacterium]
MSKLANGRVLESAYLCRTIRPLFGFVRATTLYGLLGATMTLALIALFFPVSYGFFRVVVALLPVAMVVVHMILGLCGGALAYPYWRSVVSQSQERRRVSALFLVSSALCICSVLGVYSVFRSLLAFLLLTCLEQLLSRRISLGMESLVHSSLASFESGEAPVSQPVTSELPRLEDSCHVAETPCVEEASSPAEAVEPPTSVEASVPKPTFRTHPKGYVFESYDSLLNETIGDVYKAILYQQARLAYQESDSSQLLASYYVPAREASKTAVVNIAFDPVFDERPGTFEFEQLYGPEATIRCTLCEAYGARVEVKCAPGDYDPMELIRIDFVVIGRRSGNYFD